MPSETVAPFSSRNRGAQPQVDRDFPNDARIGLLHILYQAVEKGFAAWQPVARELQRISRTTPILYDTYTEPDSSRSDAERLLMKLPWEKVYDFCERLHGSLAQEVGYTDSFNGYHVTTSRGEA